MGRAAERAGFEDMTSFSRHAVMSMAKRVLGRDFTPEHGSDGNQGEAEAAPATAKAGA